MRRRTSSDEDAHPWPRARGFAAPRGRPPPKRRAPRAMGGAIVGRISALRATAPQVAEAPRSEYEQAYFEGENALTRAREQDAR